MKKILLLILFVGFAVGANAQVGIGTADPSLSSQLEIISSDRGILIPRVRLESVVDRTTISSGNVESLLVFNITDSDLITPGYYYWFDERWRRLAWTGSEANSNNFVIYDPTTNQFFYTNEDGDLVAIDLGDLINETVTTLVDNGDGTYTHTSEDGTVTVVDVPASVVNQFEDIINSGPVTINGDTFTSIEEYIENIVALNETVTTLVDNGDGTYTHTSEDGTVTVVDV
ncbi:hypothetical protein ACFSKL_22285, partial [Belliella marina]